MINTAIFDMDGLLLDTEPLWGESMLKIGNKYGIPVTLQFLKETTGLRIYEVTEFWATKYKWEGKNASEVADEILIDIISLSKQKATILKGVVSTLIYLKENNFKIGLASSSPMFMITELINHFSLTHYFDKIVSADSVEFGKPHPAVFLYCANEFKVSPLQCIVFEDSINGIIAAKAARMKAIAVPDPHNYNNPKFAIADLKLNSLEEFNINFIKQL